jgi:arginyl-tRNA synthetase
MDKAALVGFEVEKGSRILQILDDAGLQVKVALWAYLAEYEEWRLVLSSRKFDDISLGEAYGLLHKALDAAGFPLEQTPTIVILRSGDPFVKMLRKTLGRARSVEGMRPGGQTIGDRFVEDGYAYRVL